MNTANKRLKIFKEYKNIFMLCFKKLKKAEIEYKEESFIYKNHSPLYILREMKKEHLDLVNYNMEMIRQLDKKIDIIIAGAIE